jgi:hypothetical protein
MELIRTTEFGKFGKPAKMYDDEGIPTGIEEGTWRFPVLYKGEMKTFTAPYADLRGFNLVELVELEYNGNKYLKLFDAKKDKAELDAQLELVKMLKVQ